MLIGIEGVFNPQIVYQGEDLRVYPPAGNESISAGFGLPGYQGSLIDAVRPKDSSWDFSLDGKSPVPRTEFNLEPYKKRILDERVLIRANTMRRELSPRKRYFGRGWVRNARRQRMLSSSK
jgi:hypothetical protein